MFEQLDASEFEQFSFDLLDELGFVNIDWRKGTGLPGSSPDRGRDLMAQFVRSDVDETHHLETWFVQCKHHKRGVPPEKLQSALTWAQAERPDVLLFIVSNSLSNPAKDSLHIYEQNNRPPFKIKYWERMTLERLTRDREGLLRKYLLDSGSARPFNEILDAEQEFFDKVWHDRHMMIREDVDAGRRTEAKEIWDGALAAAAEVEAKYGTEKLGPHDDFEWGMINGKLSALRWVLGDDWDMLDT